MPLGTLPDRRLRVHQDEGHKATKCTLSSSGYLGTAFKPVSFAATAARAAAANAVMADAMITIGSGPKDRAIVTDLDTSKPFAATVAKSAVRPNVSASLETSTVPAAPAALVAATSTGYSLKPSRRPWSSKICDRNTQAPLMNQARRPFLGQVTMVNGSTHGSMARSAECAEHSSSFFSESKLNVASTWQVTDESWDCGWTAQSAQQQLRPSQGCKTRSSKAPQIMSISNQSKRPRSGSLVATAPPVHAKKVKGGAASDTKTTSQALTMLNFFVATS